MPIAFPIAIGLALVLGVMINYLGEAKGDPVMLFSGVALVTLAIVLNALAYRKKSRDQQSASTKGIVISILGGIIMSFFTSKKIMRSKILVIGSSNMDLIMQVERLPKPGETITGGVFSRAFGGKGANQAVGAARAGGVIVTLGTQGSYVAMGGMKELVPAFVVNAVDTTAAGDVYCGSLATALVEGQSIKEAVRFASAAAAISVTRLGAQPSAPRRVEIEQFMSI